MNKILLELSPTQVESLIEKLPIESKVRLIKKLERETWAKRLDDVVSQIRKRFRENPLPDKEITRVCEESRHKWLRGFHVEWH